MSVEVLVAAIHQKDHSLLEKMNIQSDVIVGNQCDRNLVESFEYNGNQVTYLNFAERGVGLNRNNALMRSKADYCLFADDDMVYVDGYGRIVEEQFKKYPDADLIVFNLKEKHPTRHIIKNAYRVKWYNFMRFGAARIAVKRERIIDKNIFFHLHFGGGARYSNGEDTIFLSDCLKHGLKIYAVPITIAELTEERESSWFAGYNEKYFRDKGQLYQHVSEKYWKLLCLQDAFRHQKLYRKSWKVTYGWMTKSR